MPYDRHVTGRAGEDLALQHLLKHNLTLKERNFSCKMGEIDLIMQDNLHLVFVEVRTRNKQDFVSALESITPQKQNNIRRTALFYLQEQKVYEKMPCRFDVVTVDEHQQLDWLINAF